MAESTGGHRAKAIRMSHAWVAACEDCNWLGGDHRRKQMATEDARMHERGELHPWQMAEAKAWDPSRRPFLGT